MNSTEIAKTLDLLKDGLSDWRYHRVSDNFIQKTPNSSGFVGRARAELIARISEILTARGLSVHADADLRKYILPRLEVSLRYWTDDARRISQHFWPGVLPGA